MSDRDLTEDEVKTMNETKEWVSLQLGRPFILIAIAPSGGGKSKTDIIGHGMAPEAISAILEECSQVTKRPAFKLYE